MIRYQTTGWQNSLGPKENKSGSHDRNHPRWLRTTKRFHPISRTWHMFGSILSTANVFIIFGRGSVMEPSTSGWECFSPDAFEGHATCVKSAWVDEANRCEPLYPANFLPDFPYTVLSNEWSFLHKVMRGKAARSCPSVEIVYHLGKSWILHHLIYTRNFKVDHCSCLSPHFFGLFPKIHYLRKEWKGLFLFLKRTNTLSKRY